MNPFITNSKKINKHYLPFQSEGPHASPKAALDSIKQKKLIRLIIPHGHSLKVSWLCGLLFNDAQFFILSAASTDVGGWNEVGSLNISVSPGSNSTLAVWKNGQDFCFEEFKIKDAKLMIVERPAFYAEGGLSLASDAGASVRIAAGIAPGSLSVELPGRTEEFSPEFSKNEYLEIAV